VPFGVLETHTLERRSKGSPMNGLSSYIVSRPVSLQRSLLLTFFGVVLPRDAGAPLSENPIEG
jgi:hypothetical protein